MSLQKEETADQRLDVNDGSVIIDVRMEVVSGKGDTILRVNTTRLEPHVRPLWRDMGHVIDLDGVRCIGGEHFARQWKRHYLNLGDLVADF